MGKSVEELSKLMGPARKRPINNFYLHCINDGQESLRIENRDPNLFLDELKKPPLTYNGLVDDFLTSLSLANLNSSTSRLRYMDKIDNKEFIPKGKGFIFLDGGKPRIQEMDAICFWVEENTAYNHLIIFPYNDEKFGTMKLLRAYRLNLMEIINES